ncbi:protein of unknown function [Enterobacter cancerogenus]|uniref:DUF1367 family protein n=1 Tax=Enterobacter cancerogenus TaxID=69218 RepID=UPI001AF547C0|nr:DUF1367 family protein [Enterobacter cancerogenus]CAD5354804.1 protein of unknown function [Enterobacter cancerogenus]
MAQLQLIKQSSGILIPATPETSDLLQSKIKLGAVLVADFKQVRNPAFHRRFFALLNLGFEYWEPTGGSISSNERKLVTGYAKFLASYGGNEGALLDAAEQYLERIADKLTGSISACKSFDAYRAWVLADCKRCSGRGYERIPSTKAYAAVCQITEAISLDTWKKSVKPFYDQLITKFDIEEAWADAQLK